MTESKKKSIGIYVTSDRYLDDLILLCRAAKKKDVEISVFFTHEGTRLSTDPRVDEIKELANKVALCKVGFESNQLDPAAARVDEKGFASQSWHAEMLYDCDRYLTF
ncbi:MAG: hypothetical protein LJE65_15145 [Desulfobacteraceae bacterium]|nr:hypothetical protein [Desulfobacteraceae bacterium]